MSQSFYNTVRTVPTAYELLAGVEHDPLGRYQVPGIYFVYDKDMVSLRLSAKFHYRTV